ncbi:ATP-dependent RNA helicase DDX24 [Plodia interpunctella]|uniref:ATP-dependent RNA helicase DDX24 n=1 Tax=Plodia interpunctella TaxID=58824 RepID=UPI0023685495|nr:ATP-dependent RNA helicase DDX24 [Plodia interpunctella]
MSKKLKNLKWESVAISGFPVSMTDNFQGFVALEECTNYGMEKESKNLKTKKKKEKKRKLPVEDDMEPQDPTKKVKLSNGFVVETCNEIKPSATNEIEKTKKSKKKRNKKSKTKSEDNSDHVSKETQEVKQNKKTKITKLEVNKNKERKIKLGEDITGVVSELTPEDMLMWDEYKLPEPIVRALMELGFKKPTKIQELTLPAAIHGRRDILGAAETGSGKTLAFGLPILSGIMKLKEEAASGMDVYDIPYKKTSVKRKSETEEVKPARINKQKKKSLKKKVEKESSEDGYVSDEEDVENDVNNKKPKVKNIRLKKKSADDYLEEYHVPIRRRDNSADEGNDSDSDNYVHLSEMLDSDDLAESDSEKENDVSNDNSDSENDNDVSENSDDGEVESENDETGDEAAVHSDDESENGENMDEDSEGSQNEEDIDEDEQGIGCVKVIDDIDIPGQVVTKTGKPLYALILTPTRELAIQISRHLIAVAKYSGIRIATIVGGMAAVKQERVLQKGPEIVVATPGRLWELLSQGQTHLQQMDCVKFLAIDETDRMIERGHFEELQPLLERLNADDSRRNTRQNFVFSATLTMVHDLPSHMKGKKVTKRGKILNRKIEKMTPQQKIKRLVDMVGITDPKVVDITTQNLGTAETLTESRIACSIEQKDIYLYYILKRHPGRTIVFCNSIGSVRRLAQLFTLLKCRPLPLHASMPQRQRLKNLERFRDDPHGVLVATDVAARGLDIPDVDHVIHYQVPRTAENYVHRSGRTARASKEGITILMMEPSEAYLYGKLCRTLNKTSEVPTFPVPSSSLSLLKETVTVARELDALELRKRRTTQAVGWKEKAAREMDMIIDDDDLPIKSADPSIDIVLKNKRRKLNALLSSPLLPKSFSFKYPTLNEQLPVSQDNALQVMKKAIESGELKKEKRKSKNAQLLKLQKTLSK